MSSKKSNMRKESGITLIALIITIIILVILAAVSIRAITNQSIVGHAINGSQDYARAGKEENKVLGDTVNYLENALGKLNDIQTQALTFDLNGGEMPDGRKQVKVKLEKDMTLEELSNNEEIDYISILAFYKGYQLVSFENENGTDVKDIDIFTNNTVLYATWNKTESVAWNSIVSVNLNGGQIVIPEYPNYEKLYRRYITKGYTKALCQELWGIVEGGYITKEDYSVTGYFTNPEFTNKVYSIEHLSNDQILALDGKTIYLRWTRTEDITSKQITVHYKNSGLNSWLDESITLYSYMPASECYGDIAYVFKTESLSDFCTDSEMTTQLFTMDSGNIVFNNLTFNQLPNEIWVNSGIEFTS